MKLPLTIALTAFLWTGCAADHLSIDSTELETEGLEEVLARHRDDRNRLPNNIPMLNESGVFTTVSTKGYIDLNNEFFRDLGKNGRRCVSCHVPTAGWSITPAQLQLTFELTAGGAHDDGLGLGAVFRTVDGSNSPTADVSTLRKRRAAYSMLLDRGLIRVGMPVPPNAEFELIAVDDPYGFASAAELSLFRRPLPITNLKFTSTVMWDGREVVPGTTVASMLHTQANSANVGHALGDPLSAAQRQSLVDFQLGLATAQIYDRRAGSLRDDGARGGPNAIHAETFYIGINDNLGDFRTGAPFTPVVFDIYDAWAGTGGSSSEAEARRAIARGQQLFNTRAIRIAGVSGINDEAVFGNPAVLVGTCTTCHNTPNGGNHSIVAPLDIGLIDADRRTPDMPLYTLRNKTTGAIRRVTDPGRALVDGKWKHIGRFKGPMLRDLAARAPYFHNGSAATLAEAVEFYDTRFQIGLTAGEQADMVAFLRAL
jgi:cytochrome c peroxidase